MSKSVSHPMSRPLRLASGVSSLPGLTVPGMTWLGRASWGESDGWPPPKKDLPKGKDK